MRALILLGPGLWRVMVNSRKVDDPAEILLQRGLKGDADALGQLLGDYRPWLRVLARRWFEQQREADRIAQRVDESDAVQQTCLSAVRKIADFRGSTPAEFLAWLRVVHERNLQNLVREHVLTDKRATKVEVVLESGARLAVEASTPSQRLLQDEQSVELARWLEKLPPDQNEAVRLRYLEGCALPEIAERLGRSTTAAAGLLKRGLRRLRELMPSDDET